MFRIFRNVINNKINRNFEGKDITKEELNDYIRQGAIVIDVRSPQEFREGHIDGAICIPDYRIKREIQKQIINKDEIIILYCSTGHRSINAQRILQNLGYKNVYNLKIEIINMKISKS